MREREFQSKLIETLKYVFPDAIVLKNDEQYLQGFPDLTILNHGRFAVLEVKKSENEPFQPNQKHYIDFIRRTDGFAEVVYPENERDIINELMDWFGDGEFDG